MRADDLLEDAPNLATQRGQFDSVLRQCGWAQRQEGSGTYYLGDMVVAIDGSRWAHYEDDSGEDLIDSGTGPVSMAEHLRSWQGACKRVAHH